MPLPFLVWAVVALAGGAAAGKGGEVYGERTRAKARRAQADAQEYVASKKRKYERKRRASLERLRSFSQMIRAAVQAPLEPLEIAPDELPPDIEIAWKNILSTIHSLAPAETWLAQQNEWSEFHRKLAAGIMYNRSPTGQVRPETLGWAAITAGIFYTYRGLGQAVSAHKAYNEAVASASRARLAADQKLSAIEAVNAELEMRWEPVVGLIHRAVGPPPDAKYATMLLKMADGLTEVADELMKVGDDE